MALPSTRSPHAGPGSPPAAPYRGGPFARGGAVFVSLNYRVGTEGFAQLPGAPANRGLLDAVAALTYEYQALAAADPMALVDAQMAVTARLPEFPRWGRVSRTVTAFSPVIDGEVLPRSPWRALLAGAAADVDLLTGHNRDEYRLFVAMSGRLGAITEEEAAATLAAFAPAPDGPAANRKAYQDADPSAMYELVFSDWLFRMPTLHLAQAHAASGGRTYLYELTAEAPAGPFGACHGLDVPLVFGATGPGLTTLMTGASPPAAFTALGDAMRREWLEFAAAGDPGWPPYGTEHRATRVYALQSDVVSYPEETSMRLWERHQFDVLGLAG